VRDRDHGENPKSVLEKPENQLRAGSAGSATTEAWSSFATIRLLVICFNPLKILVAFALHHTREVEEILIQETITGELVKVGASHYQKNEGSDLHYISTSGFKRFSPGLKVGCTQGGADGKGFFRPCKEGAHAKGPYAQMSQVDWVLSMTHPQVAIKSACALGKY
jgi:hypothetical protein